VTGRNSVTFVPLLPLIYVTLALVLRAMDSDCSDAELVQYIAARGSDAARAEALLYRRFAGRIELYGRRHLESPSAARDLVQQVLLYVLKRSVAGAWRTPRHWHRDSRDCRPRAWARVSEPPCA
jgi:hypothetical protein